MKNTLVLLGLCLSGFTASAFQCANVFNPGVPAAQENRSTNFSDITVWPGKTVGKVSNKLKQIFLEPMKGSVKGVSANMIDNPSFEGPLKSDGLPEGWHVGPSKRLDNVEWTYKIVSDNSVNRIKKPQNISKNQQALLVNLTSARDLGEGLPRGISLHELTVENKKTYVLKLFLKSIGQEPYKGKLKVSLTPAKEAAVPYCQELISDISPEYSEYTVELSPKILKSAHSDGRDLAAWLNIEFEGRGELLIDHVTLLSSDHVDGIHRKVIENSSFGGPLKSDGLPVGWHVGPSKRLDNVEWTYKVVSKNSFNQLRNPVLPEKNLQALFVNLKSAGNLREGLPRGISHHELPIKSERPYVLKLWAKSTREKPFEGKLKVSLTPAKEAAVPYCQGYISGISAEYTEYTMELTPKILKSNHPDGQDLAAWLNIEFDGGGELLIDHVTLMPSDHVDGVSRKVFELLKALKPSSTRYGGIAGSHYDMLDVLGLQSTRYYFKTGWDNELHPSHFGPHENAMLSKNLGAAPTVTVNLHGENAIESMMKVAEYFFGDENTEWGKKRVEAGLKEPLDPADVPFEFDNEPWLNIPALNASYKEVSEYIRLVKAFAVRLHETYPQAKIILAGDRNPDWWKPVIQSVGKYAWAIALHWYMEWHEQEWAPQAPKQMENVIREMIAFNHRENPGHKIQVAFNEWNPRLIMPNQQGMEGGINAASVWNMVIRNANLVTMSTNAFTVNGGGATSINVDKAGQIALTTIYLQNLLYFNNLGDHVVKTDVQGPSHIGGEKSPFPGQATPWLDTAATKSKDGKTLYMYVVNRNTSEDLSANLKLEGVHSVIEAERKIIRAESLKIHNTFDNPDAIQIETIPVASPSVQMNLTFPKHSISVFKFKIL